MQTTNMTGYPSIDKPWMKYYDESKLDFNFPKKNVYDYLKKQAKGYEDHTAITYFGMEITYARLFEHIDEAARALYALGVRQGTRYFCSMAEPNWGGYRTISTRGRIA